MYSSSRKAFTLIELLVVIAIIAVLAIVVILTLNPQALLQQSRDSNRVSDLSTLTDTLSQYSTDLSGSAFFNMGSSSVVYVSIPDPTATSTAGDQCQGLGLISLPSTYTYHCAATSTYRNVNGTGWIPVNFQTMSTGAPLGTLPVDPSNNSSSRLYYTYTTNGTQYEITAVMESAKYGPGGSNDVIDSDGGPLASVYEKGSKLGLEPLDYGDPTLVGYWPLTEGASTVAYDDSGNNVTGTWNGSQIGTNGYYTNNTKVGPYAGDFDGASTYITATTTIPAGQLTYTAWINASMIDGNTHFIEGVQHSNQPGSRHVRLVGSSVQFLIVADNSSGYLLGTPSIASNTWYFIVSTIDPNYMNLYFNGALWSTSTYSGGLTTQLNYFTIGRRSDSAQNYFSGLIEDVRIYSRSLSAAQIAAMYTGGK